VLLRRLVVALFLPALAACTASPDAAETPAAPPPSARDVLLASTSGIEAGNYRFTVAENDNVVSGSVHLPSRSAGWSVRDPKVAKAETRVVDGQIYTTFTTTTGTEFGWTKSDGPVFGTALPDVVGVRPLLAGVVTAEGAAPAITGTVDVTKVRSSTDLFGAARLQLLAPGAGTAVPFTAALDPAGRLTRFEMPIPDMSDKKTGTWTFEFSAYGEAQPVVTPRV
jgi:hypothetical protein